MADDPKPATASVAYLGGLRTRATHLQSGDSFLTDAPTDNMGRGEAFSPTDLLATSLLTCILTTIAIVFQKRGWAEPKLEGTVLKGMADSPRRVARLDIHITATGIPVEQRQLLEATAHACPVARSLHPDVVQELTFEY